MNDDYGQDLFKLLFELSSQASKVYRAQTKAWHPEKFAELIAADVPGNGDYVKNANNFFASSTGDFKDSNAIRDYCENIRTSKYVAKHWPKFARNDKNAYTLLDSSVKYISEIGQKNEGGAVTNPQLRHIFVNNNEFANSREVVLHELAHLIAYDENPTAVMFDGHGGMWVKIFLMLINEFLGQESFDKLVTEFKKEGVSIASFGSAWEYNHRNLALKVA